MTARAKWVRNPRMSATCCTPGSSDWKEFQKYRQGTRRRIFLRTSSHRSARRCRWSWWGPLTTDCLPI